MARNCAPLQQGKGEAMLQEFYRAAAQWTPPAVLLSGPAKTHFGQRAAERGVNSIPGDVLKWAIERAVTAARHDLVEHVFDIDPATRVYRVILPEGVFYPVISRGGTAMTIYTQGMLRQVRNARRGRKQACGCRERQARGGRA